MKTRFNNPFIYFLVEPTNVLVYRFETRNYITISDLMENTNIEAFQINHQNEFDHFNHLEMQPASGTSFFLNQAQMKEIVNEINTHLQQTRRRGETDYPFVPVHIVTSESTAGSLKVGLQRPKTVIGFPDSFSIGPLWKLEEKSGQNYRSEWFYEHINDEQDDYVYETKFENTLRVIEDIPEHAPIYIWYGNNSDEQIGLRFYIYLLREKKYNLFLINTSEYSPKHERAGVNHPIINTGQYHPESLKEIFENNKENKPLNQNERIFFQKEWEKLSQSKDALRIWTGNEIKNVTEDYYDALIIRTMENLQLKYGAKEFIKTGLLIEEVYSNMKEYSNIFFLEYRIRHLIYSGVFVLKGIPKSMRHYRVRIR